MKKNIIDLIAIKGSLIQIQVILLIVLISLVIIFAFLLNKKIKIVLLVFFAIYCLYKAYYMIQIPTGYSNNTNITNKMELQKVEKLNSNFFGLMQNEIKFYAFVTINKDTTLIDKVHQVMVDYKGILGSQVIEGNYRVVNGGRKIDINFTNADGSLHHATLEPPNIVENDKNATLDNYSSEISLNDEIIVDHNQEIKDIIRGILFSVRLLFILTLAFVIHFIIKYTSNKYNLKILK